MEVRSENRFPVKLQGRYRYGSGMAKDVVVEDLSRRGCKFFDRFSNLRPGSIISIRIGSVGPLHATVKWTEKMVVGVQFDQPLHESILDHMRTNIENWLPDSQEISETTPQTNAVQAEAAPEVISVRIRSPSASDVKFAVAALHMQFPLKTEAEWLAVFHAVLNRIFVEPD